MFTSDVSARGVDYPDVSLVVQVCNPHDRLRACLKRCSKPNPCFHQLHFGEVEWATCSSTWKCPYAELRGKFDVVSLALAAGTAGRQGAVHPPRRPHGARRQARPQRAAAVRLRGALLPAPAARRDRLAGASAGRSVLQRRLQVLVTLRCYVGYRAPSQEMYEWTVMLFNDLGFSHYMKSEVPGSCMCFGCITSIASPA